MATVPVIDGRRANAFALDRQGLNPDTADALAAVRRIVAVQSQYPACVAQSVRARSTGPTATEVDRLVNEDHALVRTWCLRGTVHTFAAADLPLMVGAFGRRRRERHRKVVTDHYGITAKDLTAMERGMLKALKHGPVSRKQLKDTVPEYHNLKGKGYGIDVAGLAAEGKIVFAPLIKGDTAFVLREQWLPDLPWDVPPERAAWAELARRYYAGYGPASWADFRRFTACQAKEIPQIREDVEADLAEVTVKGWPDQVYVLKTVLAELLEGQAKLPPVSLLPKFDAVTLGYDYRDRWLDQQYADRIYRPAAQVEAVVLVKGRMAATWRIKPGKVIQAEVMPFEPLSKTVAGQIEREFAKLAKFYGADGIEIDIEA